MVWLRLCLFAMLLCAAGRAAADGVEIGRAHV